MSANIAEEKRALREVIRARRRDLSPEERAVRARAAADHLLSLPAIRQAETVLLFYAFGEEPPTRGVSERLRELGVRILLPRISEGRIEAADAGVGVVPTGYGPREPSGEAVELSDVDVVVAPGLAFDRSGNRLGRGGGHYDRLLGDLPHEVVTVGLAFAEELLDEVPVEVHDRPVDIVVTDEGVTVASSDPPL